MVLPSSPLGRIYSYSATKPMNQVWLSRTAAIYLTKCSCFMYFHSSARYASTIVIRRPFAHIQWSTNFLITFINPSGVPSCHIILRPGMGIYQPGILIAASSSSSTWSGFRWTLRMPSSMWSILATTEVAELSLE